MSDGNDFNARNIAEFRANHGRVGGPFEGAPMVILHTVGAKSGQPRTNIMMYQADGERYLVFASNNGRDDNPAWYWNLKANPDPASKLATTSSTCMPPCCRAPSGTTSTQCRPSGIRDSRSTNATRRGPSQLSPSRPSVWPKSRRMKLAPHRARLSAPNRIIAAPATLPLTSPKGIVFSSKTKMAIAAIHKRFITPPTNSNAIRIQQQPTQ
jgi:hypothetical protein